MGKDLPEEKVKSFSKILGKFFDAEAADYKKEVAAKVPNYNRLLEKAGDKVLDFNMRNRIVEIDRDADRRYTFATRKIKKLAEKGEMFPQSSPMMEAWEFANDDAESHEALKKVMEAVKAAGYEAPKKEDVEGRKKEIEKTLLANGVDPANVTKAIDSYDFSKSITEKMLEKGVPPMGEKFIVLLPMQLVNQLHSARKTLIDAVETFKENHTEAEVKELEAALPEQFHNVIMNLMKTYFRSQTADKYKTKADVLKALWAEIPKFTGKPVPPVDEELLAELEEVPAVQEGEFRHNWGIADKLYKSEAIDAFGMKYLLGVFDTMEEAQKAFTEWNDEYEKARADMKSEMQQWSKQENARLEADTSGSDRIKKILEEARR